LLRVRATLLRLLHLVLRLRNHVGHDPESAFRWLYSCILLEINVGIDVEAGPDG
jgi:hypothetical protein